MCFFFVLSMKYLDMFMTKKLAVNLDIVIVTLTSDKAVCSFETENNLGLQTNGSIENL